MQGSDARAGVRRTEARVRSSPRRRDDGNVDRVGEASSEVQRAGLWKRMTMSQPSFWWQKYGTLAQMAQAGVALLGFVAILFQINEIRTNNRAASARAAFLGYTDLAVKNPKFSYPDYDTIKASSRDERTQYESFVSYFLYACEETINAFADKREWQASCDYDLKPHLPFLCEKNAAQPAYLATYGTETQQWVKTSLKTASLTPPDCKLGKT